MQKRIQVPVALLCLAAHCVSGEVRSQPDSEMIAFAAEDLVRAVGETSPGVVVGTYAWLRKQGVAAAEPPSVSEAFAVSVPREGEIVVAGHDEAGAMYGGLEVAEQIRIAGLDTVKARTAKPFLAMRQYKYNLP